VEGFIDRLAELLKTLFGNGAGNPVDARDTGAHGSDPQRFVDPDVQAAWEELDEYIRTGTNTSSGRSSRSQGGERARRPHAPEESLRQDYANLEVSFGADIEVVRESYKRLMLKYHPDKFPGNPEKQKLALEIAKKINQSFERIRNHQESEGWSS
jgi:hypothetical protein